MATVAVIDYGMGNIRSVSKALEHVSGETKVIVTREAEAVLRADRVVLPGVGALQDCVSELKRLGLDDVIRETVRNKPFMGICLGMQALLDSSAENGGTEALGIIPGETRHFADQLKTIPGTKTLKVPHMGWNQVHQSTAHPMWQGIKQNSRFYFVHSYYVDFVDDSVVSATTPYGFDFTSVIAQENIFAVQFHPEKSQHAGLALLANFLSWDGSN
ncbi:MAG: imidazole glycerol phosphate synthase subunit HisH [Gammaproteobacteria bacterium]|nr:imidazole glycerol phosphate synthase subunit HisH [Gammaproteobacteria bacterium]